MPLAAYMPRQSNDGHAYLASSLSHSPSGLALAHACVLHYHAKLLCIQADLAGPYIWFWLLVCSCPQMAMLCYDFSIYCL